MLIAGFVGTAQAGVKVDVVFKNPGYTYTGGTTTTCLYGTAAHPSDCVNLGNVRIYRVGTDESCWMTNGNKSCKFEDVQSGFSPKLFRFEWRADIARPAQVVDSWIDVPNTNTHNQTWIYNVPAHNVVFTSQVGNRDIGMISQSIVGDRRQNSRINKKSDAVILLKGNLTGGMTPKNVPMLDGCYTVYYYADNTCPGNSCVRNYLDYPVCVGGIEDVGELDDKVNAVDLSTDNMPNIYTP